MRHLAIASVMLLVLVAGGVAFAQTTGPGGPVPPVISVPPVVDEPGGSPNPLPLGVDGDYDGWGVQVDCNDDDPLVNPAAPEIANGIDDNCNGVVDEGFDTSLDFANVTFTGAVWPDPVRTPLGEHVSTEKPPRLVWTGEAFVALWIDVRERLRVTRFGMDGLPEFPPVTLAQPAKAMDVAWTGRRFGVVYEDGSVRGTSSVRLLILDQNLRRVDDVLLAAQATEPRIAWGQDRFGVVWSSISSVNNVRFQRFGADGYPLAPAESLEHSGGSPSIAFDGTIVAPQSDGSIRLHRGKFGVVYEARYAFAVSGDVLLKAFPRDVETEDPIGPVRVNQHNDAWSAIGQIPSISGNQSGFLVAWHASSRAGKDMAQSRFFSHDTLAPSQEFIPDSDSARYGRLIWTGGEFIMANDNRTTRGAGTYDVHLRRFDGSGNSHVSSPAGAWSEVNLRNHVRGNAAVHPDLAVGGDALGMIWVEQDTVLKGTAGRLYFAKIAHK